MKNKLTFLLIFILFLVYWKWFLPGSRVASDFPIISNATLKAYLDIPRVWSENGAEGLGEYSVFTLWSYPLNLISGVLSNIGLEFAILERIIFIIPILLFGSFGIWKLSEEINLSSFAKVVSTFFYLTNTYILLLIDGGQLSIALAYSFLPICFLSIKKSIKGNLKSKIISGLLISILGFFDIRFLFILFFLSIIYFIYEILFTKSNNKFLYFVRGLRILFIISVVILGIHIYWLLTLYKVPLQEGFFRYLTNITVGGFTNIGHSLTLLSPNWYKNVFGSITEIKWQFLFVPILVFLAPILRNRSKEVGFWLIVSVVSIFLTKGTNPPLGNIYSWLFTYIPGFSLFRDSTKFFFLTALSYSILIGTTIDSIPEKIKNRKLLNWLFFSIILYLVALVSPVISNQMTGTFSSQPMQMDYQKLGQIIQSDNNFSRIFWIPAIPPLGYSNPTHPWIEAARLYQRRPFSTGVKGTYEVFNFLREASYMGQIFDVFGIGYIGYPYLDVRRDNLHPENVKYYNVFTEQLSKLSWLTKVSDSLVPLWKVNEHQDKFFLSPNLWWIVGSDDIYEESTKSAKLSLSKNAFVFSEQIGGLGNDLEKIANAKIILNNKTLIDLAASFTDPKDLIFPAKFLEHNPNSSGWWKRDTSEFLDWKNFLNTKYGIDNQDFDLGGGWAVSEKALNLKINNENFKKDKILLARVLESSSSGEIKFYQEKNLIGQINTLKKESKVGWFEIGKLVNNQELTISTNGSINVINALETISEDNWRKYKNLANSYQNKITEFKDSNVSTNSGEINYKQISSTEYKITIRNLQKPSTLVFGENFDKRWKLNGKSSLPVYSSLNGFSIEENGQYYLIFEPQKYVSYSLVLSILTIFICAAILLV